MSRLIPVAALGSLILGLSVGCGGGKAASGSPTIAAPSQLKYPSDKLSATWGVALPLVTPTVSGAVTGFTVSPALPAGLRFESLTGEISGTPTEMIGIKPYIVTASNSSGTATTTLSIEVGPKFLPNPTAEATSSYALAHHSMYVSRYGIRSPGLPGFVLAFAFADFSKRGKLDVFMARGDGSPNASPFEFYRNLGDGSFVADPSVFSGPMPGGIHPRKAILGDFNQDGRLDILIADHGYDQPPFPGAMPILLLSNPDGTWRSQSLPAEMKAFNHGAASGDIHNNGSLAVFLTGMGTFWWCDGKGQFTQDPNLTAGITFGGVFTVELADVDQDGYLDLVVGGHEFDSANTTVYWGDGTGQFSNSRKSILPPVPGMGVVLDIKVEDLDGDGSREILLNRAGSPPNFYVGSALQILHRSGRTFTDVTSQCFPKGDHVGPTWFDWVRVLDVTGDGKLDIVADDKALNLVWKGDGQGHFAH